MEFKYLDKEIPQDPIFSDMTEKFNNESIKGLLFNILPIDENLDIKIDENNNKDINNKDNNFLSKNFQIHLSENQMLNLNFEKEKQIEIEKKAYKDHINNFKSKKLYFKF